MLNRATVGFLFLVLITTCIGLVMSASTLSAEKSRFAQVTFATHTTVLKFFDPSTGKIYVYSEHDGSILQIWQIQSLGKNLKMIYNAQKF